MLSCKNKILVAEDEEINFLYIDILIKKKYPNLKIIHAKDGLEAVELFSLESNIGLVFMDIKMPKMNGYEAMAKIKSLKKSIPVIALTAYSSEDDVEYGMKVGFDEYLTKPIDKQRFFSIIKNNFSS